MQMFWMTHAHANTVDAVILTMSAYTVDDACINYCKINLMLVMSCNDGMYDEKVDNGKLKQKHIL